MPDMEEIVNLIVDMKRTPGVQEARWEPPHFIVRGFVAGHEALGDSQAIPGMLDRARAAKGLGPFPFKLIVRRSLGSSRTGGIEFEAITSGPPRDGAAAQS